MLEPGAHLVAALVGHAAAQGLHLVPVGNDYTALTGGHLLVRVETKRPASTYRAGLTTPVLRPNTLARIGDNLQPVPVGDLLYGVPVGRVAEDIHGENRLGSRGNRGLYQRGVEVIRIRLDVHKDGSGTFVQKAVGRGDERKRGGDHLVSRAQTDGPTK